MFHLLERVVLSDQTVEVSTVDLSLPEYGIVQKGFETALFFEDGGWETVEWYPTVDAAIAGHGAWSRPAVVGYVLSAVKAEATLNKIIEG